MRSIKLLPLVKLFGRKARSDPAISIMLRTAMTASIRPSWKRSTMSVVSCGLDAELTGTHDLEEVLFFKLFKDGCCVSLKRNRCTTHSP
jgi:hypothetical protein